MNNSDMLSFEICALCKVVEELVSLLITAVSIHFARMKSRCMDVKRTEVRRRTLGLARGTFRLLHPTLADARPAAELSSQAAFVSPSFSYTSTTPLHTTIADGEQRRRRGRPFLSAFRISFVSSLSLACCVGLCESCIIQSYGSYNGFRAHGEFLGNLISLARANYRHNDTEQPLTAHIRSVGYILTAIRAEQAKHLPACLFVRSASCRQALHSSLISSQRQLSISSLSTTFQ